MKRLSLLLLIIPLLFSCTSTKGFVSDISLDTELTLEEKMEIQGFDNVHITMPKVYFDGHEWKDRLIELIDRSEDYILFTYFFASNSDTVMDVYDAIERAAERGVDIYLAIDGTSTFDMTETKFCLYPLYPLRDKGIKLLEYNPLSATHAMAPFSLLKREHRKIIIVDGKTVVLGGMNMNYISIGAPEERMQRDSMYEFYSPELCRLLVDSFVSWWNEWSCETIERDFSVDEHIADGMPMYNAYFCNQDVKKKTDMADFYGSIIGSAKHEVNILPFLPFMDERMRDGLALAQKRGVEVTMLVPFDSRVGNRTGIEYMTEKLREMNINLRIEKGDPDVFVPLLHEKLMVVDDRYVVFGSTNLNFRSMTLSNEISLVMDCPKLAESMNGHYDEFIEESVPITKEMTDEWHKITSWPRYIFGFFGG